MVRLLKQSTAKTLRFGPFVDDSDGKTAETGLTISQADIRLSKNGAAFAQTNDSSGATHDENGWYYLQLDTTDTGTLGPLTVAIHESGALPVWADFLVVPANVYDSWVSGSDYLQIDLLQILGHTITQSGTQVADGFEHFFDHATPAITVGDAMRGTDSANTTVPDAAGTAATLHATTDGKIDGLNDYDGSDTSGTTTLLTRLSADRAGYLDKLNVSGTLAHSDTAATYKATGFSTHAAADVVTALGTGSTLSDCATATGFSTHSAADVVTALGTGSTLTDCLTASGFSTFNAASDKVYLGDGAHGGSSASITLSSYSDFQGAGGATAEQIWTYATRVLTAGTNIDGSTFTSLPEVTTDSASRTASKADVSALATAAALATVDANVDAILVDTGTTLPATLSTINGYVDCLPATLDGSTLTNMPAGTLTASERNSVADAVLKRDIDNVEATANEHTLCTIVLAMLESSVSGTTWTIKRTDGSTTHASKTVTTDSSADPITGVQ